MDIPLSPPPKKSTDETVDAIAAVVLIVTIVAGIIFALLSLPS